MVKCRPYYLPRVVAVTVAVIDGNDQQTAHPIGFFIISGDFDHANLKTVFLKLTTMSNLLQQEKIHLCVCVCVVFVCLFYDAL